MDKLQAVSINQNHQSRVVVHRRVVFESQKITFFKGVSDYHEAADSLLVKAVGITFDLLYTSCRLVHWVVVEDRVVSTNGQWETQVVYFRCLLGLGCWWWSWCGYCGFTVSWMALKLHPFVVSLATTNIPCSLVHRRRPRTFFSSFSG